MPHSLWTDDADIAVFGPVPPGDDSHPCSDMLAPLLRKRRLCLRGDADDGSPLFSKTTLANRRRAAECS